MSRRNYARITRLTNIGLVLTSAILITGMVDFIYSLSLDYTRIPLFFQLFTNSDPVWSVKIGALLVISFVLISLEDVL